MSTLSQGQLTQFNLSVPLLPAPRGRPKHLCYSPMPCHIQYYLTVQTILWIKASHKEQMLPLVLLRASGNLLAAGNKICRHQCPNLQQDGLFQQVEHLIRASGSNLSSDNDWLPWQWQVFVFLSSVPNTVTCFSPDLLENWLSAHKPLRERKTQDRNER